LGNFAATAGRGEFAGKADADALVDIIALATVGAALAVHPQSEWLARMQSSPAPDEARGDGPSMAPRRLRPSASPAWNWCPWSGPVGSANSCGCLFLGRVEAGIAYPDRLAPVGAPARAAPPTSATVIGHRCNSDVR